jgi:hypothetical protein
MAWLILVLLLAMVFFYFQATCQRILRRQFGRQYSQFIADMIRLEFLSLQKAMEGSSGPVEHSQVPRMLNCDFHALTYLLRNTSGASQRFSLEERLLILYFRWQLVSLEVRRLLKASEIRTILRLTSILEYFANAVGQRVSSAGFGNLTAADDIPNV